MTELNSSYVSGTEFKGHGFIQIPRCKDRCLSLQAG